MARKRRLYIVCWDDANCDLLGESVAPMIGYLPLNKIPETSFLRKAIFSADECLEFNGDALKGIYEKRKLADEHMRIEKTWRGKRYIFWIVPIEKPTRR